MDIGGGQGEVKGRVKSWDVKDYEVLDLPDFDIQGKAIVWTDYRLSANLVFCLEVFEYLIDPLQAMKNIAIILKEKGKAYVTFAFAYPHHNELEMDSLRYTEPGIKRMADRAGLKVTNTWYRYDRSGLLKAFYQADGMRMAKQYPRHAATGFICELSKS